MATNDKAEIARLVEQVGQTPGFTVVNTAGGFQRIMGPVAELGAVVSPRSGGARTLANFKSDLHRIGWNYDLYLAAEAERKAQGMQAAREEEARLMAAAEARIAQDSLETQVVEAERAAEEAAEAEARRKAEEEAELARMIAEEERAAAKAAKVAAGERNREQAKNLLAKKKAAEAAISESKKPTPTPPKEQLMPDFTPIPPPAMPVVPKVPGSSLNPFMAPVPVGVFGQEASSLKFEPEDEGPEYDEDYEDEPEGLTREQREALADFIPVKVYFTAEMAAKALEAIQCRQRHFSQTNADKWLAAMEDGEWEFNPSDAIVFDNHYRGEEYNLTYETPEGPRTIRIARSCLINGQHRLWAVLAMSEEKRQQYYPNGVPFLMVYGFPSEKAHIFDTGKTRSGADALTVDGLPGWGNLQISALRLVLRFDASFRDKTSEKDRINGVKNWGAWNGVRFSHKQLREAGRGDYRTVKDFHATAHRLYTSKVNKTAGMAFGFLIERDNPHGSPDKPNQLFIDGVAGRAPLGDRDPRMAMMRYAMLGAESGRGKWDAGATHLAHLLKEYANWHIPKPVDISQIEPTQPMPRVWRAGMDWYGSPKVLRYPLRTPRI